MHAWHMQLSGENNRFHSQAVPSRFKVPSGPAPKTRPGHSVQVRLYRPQTKVMFSQVFVYPRGERSQSLSWGGVSAQGGGSLFRGVSVHGIGGLCPGGST